MPGSQFLSDRSVRRLLGWLVFAVSFTAYVKTLCPTIYTMDNAELTIAAYKLSIAHPTGYPLFCLLGKLFTLAIPAGEIAHRIGVMNAVFGALTAVFLFLLLYELTEDRLVSVGVSLLFSLSRLFWETSTSGEVYTLNAMFLALNMFLLTRWIRAKTRAAAFPEEQEEAGCCDRGLYPLAFFTGLSLTDHLTSAFVLPGALAAVLICDRSLFTRGRTLFRLAGLFLLPLSLYAYIPLRAHVAADASAAWGSIYIAEGFIPYVTGKMFRPLMFSSPLPYVWDHLLRFCESALAQFPLHIAWLLPVGAIALRRKSKAAFAAIGVIGLVDAIYAINYNIPDIDSYYIPAMLSLAVFLACGVQLLLERQRAAVNVLTVGVLFATVGLLAAGNYRAVDKSGNYMVEDYVKNLFNTAPRNSLLIACGDSVFNGLLYRRVVHHERPDLVILERHFVRVWRPYCKRYSGEGYLMQVGAQAPEIIRAYRARPYTRKQMKREELLADIIAEAVKVRPVYKTCNGLDYKSHPFLRRIAGSYQLIPEGIAFRILPNSRKIDKQAAALYSEALWSNYTIDDGIYGGSIFRGLLERDIPGRYFTFITALGEFEFDAGMNHLAAANFRKAVNIDYRELAVRNNLAVAFARTGDLSDAIREWRTILHYVPKDRLILHNLSVTQRLLAQPQQENKS